MDRRDDVQRAGAQGPPAGRIWWKPATPLGTTISKDTIASAVSFSSAVTDLHKGIGVEPLSARRPDRRAVHLDERPPRPRQVPRVGFERRRRDRGGEMPVDSRRPRIPDPTPHREARLQGAVEIERRVTRECRLTSAIGARRATGAAPMRPCRSAAPGTVPEHLRFGPGALRPARSSRRGREYREYWEVAMSARAFRSLGVCATTPASWESVRTRGDGLLAHPARR